MDVDWQVGETIVPPISFLTIIKRKGALNGVYGRTITADKPFKNKCVSVEFYRSGKDLIKVRADMALLTRSIKIKRATSVSARMVEPYLNRLRINQLPITSLHCLKNRLIL